ncbi:SusC/RagA family TonB-linked outer membrane protein [Dysgonomonas sp.]
MNNSKQGKNKLLKKILCLLAVAILCSFTDSYATGTKMHSDGLSEQQQTRITVKGKVIDVDGDPLIGVSVSVKGTTHGVLTDANGSYTITTNSGSTLVFTYVGYKTQSISIGQKNTIDVTMESNATELGEVEIVAEFGLKRVARAIGSSVQNVKASDIIESGRDNFISALQGRVSGMNVVSSGGAPGASTTVTLRSLTSISGNNQPLYVVDGIPMNNSSFNPSTGFAKVDVYASRDLDFSSRGNDFNPEDIESMTILKGAAAAALYGSNASNGAIIITTKKGQPGRGKVSYSNSFRWDNAYGIPEQQTKYANGAYGATNYYNLNRFGGLFPDDTKIYDNVAAILQTGFTSKHNLSVEAGTEKLSLRASASFQDQTGVIKTTDYTRSNISVAGKAEINKWLKFETSIQYAGTTNSKARKGSSGPLYYAMRWPIIDNMANYLDPDGSHMRYPERYIDGDLVNPMFQLYKNKYYDESDRIIANAVAIINPTKETFVRAQIGWDVGSQTFITSEHPYWSTYNYDIQAGNGGTYNQSKSNFSDPTLNFLAGFNKNFLGDKLILNAQIGYHQLENKNSSLSAYGTNYAVLDMVSIKNTDPITQTAGTQNTKRRIQAISGQVEFGYNNLAFLTLRARNDWSSTLPKQHNSYFYPAAELAFVASELPFIKPINNVVNYLKLRGAVAQVGKDASPLSINPELIPTELTGKGYKYYWTGPNLDLKPEMTTSWEAGFEGRFLNDRIVADFTYFNTRCDDQIVNGFRMSYASGFVLNTRNMGSFKTWGWEGHIDGDIINQKGLRWNVGLNLSHTSSEVLSMPVPEYYDAYTWNSGNLRNGVVVGKPVTTIMGNDFKRNEKGDVLINPTTGVPVVSSALSYLGDREPMLRMGITTALTYKGLRLSAMFAGKLDAMIVNGTKRYMMQNGSSWESVKMREKGAVVFRGILEDGLENTANPTVNNISVTFDDYSSTTYTGADPNWIEKNVNYIRLQELRLSYTLPSKFLKKLWGGLISYASVYVCGNDLYTWTNYSGIDAVGNTVSASAGGVGGEGYDTWALPNPRGITCGFSLTF